MEIRTFTWKPTAGYQCPACGGLGHNGDGMSCFGSKNGEATYMHRPATPCHECKGKGRVKVVPLEG